MHRETNMDAAPRRRAEDGQTMAEYAVVLGMITLLILLTFQRLGDTAGGVIRGVADLIPG